MYKKIGVRVIKKKSRVFVACIFKEDFVNPDIYESNIAEWKLDSRLELLDLYVKE